MIAILKQTRLAPKKANLVASLVRNMKVDEAINILKFTRKKGAPLIKKLIESAAANAENNFKQNKGELYIKEITVNEGPTYKRRILISRGRAHPILKRTSHIKIELEAKAPKQPEPKPEPKPKSHPNK